MATGLVLTVGVAPAAQAAGSPSVGDWLRRQAAPITSIDPAAPLGDLAVLRPMVGDARVVGLGESTHGAREEILLKHRTLRYLVEELGFRSIAWEEDWTVGLEVDRYVRGAGELEPVLAKMATTWRNREIAAVLRWLRDYNAGRADKVRFVGVEFFATGHAAYDAVAAHVAEVAPERLPAMERHLRALRPDTADIGRHVQWYYGATDKRPYVRHARQLYELVERLPRHDRALHHARQILSFYEYFASEDMAGYRDRHAAANLRWWRARTGDRIAYWAATPHTANAPGLTIVTPSGPALRFDAAGSYLRRWYGRQYTSIGFTFDRGTLNDAAGRPARVPSPPRRWADSAFGAVKPPQFAVDLRGETPPAVRAWAQGPARVRVVGDYDPAAPAKHYMSGGSLAQWFDVIIHRQVVSPPTPL
jgi:erythromycin esterase